MLNTGTEASKVMPQDLEFLRTGRMYFLRNCAYCAFEYLQDSGLVTTTALCWEAAGLRLKLKELT